MEEKRRSIDEELLRAYQHTVYRVLDPPFALRIGRQHPALDRWLLAREANCWAFLTAANPDSRLLAAAENQQHQSRLQAALAAAGYATYPAAGEALDGKWPPEPSWLVPRLDRPAGLDWARRYEQLALVWGRTGEAAQLVLTGE